LKILNQKSSQNSLENITTEKNESLTTIFNKKKEIEFKKKFYIRFLFSILATNILTFQIASNDTEVKEVTEEVLTRDGYNLFTLPLQVTFPLAKNGSKTILMSENNTTISNNAKILRKLIHHQTQDNESVEYYLISIPQKDFKQVIKYKGQQLYAYPYRKNSLNNGVPNEISF